MGCALEQHLLWRNGGIQHTGSENGLIRFIDWYYLKLEFCLLVISDHLNTVLQTPGSYKELYGIFFQYWLLSWHCSNPLIDGLLLIWLFFLQVLPSQQITSQALSERSLRCRTPFWPRTFRLLSQLQEGCLCFCTSFISSISEYFRSGFIRLPWPIFQESSLDCISWFLFWHTVGTEGPC